MDVREQIEKIKVGEEVMIKGRVLEKDFDRGLIKLCLLDKPTGFFWVNVSEIIKQ